MRILFLLLFLSVTSFCSSQVEFGPSNYFYFDSYGFRIIDSLFVDHGESKSVYLPDYPEQSKGAFVTSQKKLRLKTGNLVQIDRIGDSLIIYQEGKNLSNYFWEREVSFHGELKMTKKMTVDVGAYKASDPLSNKYGEPLTRIDSNGIEQFVYDTYYALVPDGLWYCKIDSLNYEMGEFDMGKRVGEWKIFSTVYNTFRQHPLLKVKSYEDGNLVEIKNLNRLNKLHHPAQVQLAIEGKWHNTGLTIRENSWRIQGARTTYVFSRDSNEFKYSGRGALDYLNLKGDETFDKVIGRSCGTGGDLNESHRRKEWFVDKKGDLILDNRVYLLVFLSEEKMVIVPE